MDGKLFLFLFLSLFFIAIILGVGIVKSSQGFCVTELPDKPLVDETTGKAYYVGGEQRQTKTYCAGGFLFLKEMKKEGVID